MTIFGIFNPLAVDLQLTVIPIRVQPRRVRISLSSRINTELALLKLDGTKPTSVSPLTAEQTEEWREWFIRVCQTALAGESRCWPTKAHQTVRGMLTEEPLLRGCYGGTGTPSEDNITNSRFNPTLRSYQTRSRSYQEVAISVILFIVCTHIATNVETRELLNRSILPGMKVPSVLNEKLKCIRKSQCGNFEIVPDSVDLPIELLQACNLTGTVFDYAFLRTQNGINAFLDLCQSINNDPDNYISMSELELIQLSAGYQTTQNALTCEPDPSTQVLVSRTVSNQQLRSQAVATGSTPPVITFTNLPFPGLPGVFPDILRCLPGHSYGTSVNPIQATDAWVYGQRLMNMEPLQPVPFLIGDISESAQFDVSNSSIAYYMAKRGAGFITNSNEPTDPLAGVDQERRTTGTDTPRGSGRDARSHRERGNGRGDQGGRGKSTKVGAHGAFVLPTPFRKTALVLTSMLVAGQISPRIYARIFRPLIE